MYSFSTMKAVALCIIATGWVPGINSFGRQLFLQERTIKSLLSLVGVMVLALTWYAIQRRKRGEIGRRGAQEAATINNPDLEQKVREHSATIRILLEKFRASESKFHTVFEHSAIGMALLSLKGKWLKVNKRLSDMVGYREQELLTMSFHDLGHPEDAEEYPNIIDDALKNKHQPYQVEKRYVCKNGAIVWVSINMAAVLDKKGGPLYFVSEFEDITERKKTEQRLKNAYKLIRGQVQRIQGIAWKQSHLVRSPLANLKGLIDLLKDDPSDKETLNYIQAELERLDTAIIQMADDACNKGAIQIAVKKRFFRRPAMSRVAG